MESRQEFGAEVGEIVTFYSYKGGTGRSMALANVAWILASARKKVLAIDWDLEAPGLHRYFQPFLIDKDLADTEGLVDILAEYGDQTASLAGSGGEAQSKELENLADLSRRAITLDFDGFPEGGGIDFLPAGRQDDLYAIKVTTFDWKNFYEGLNGGQFLDRIKRCVRSKYDFVLIDSRTGVSDTAGICTSHMPETLVVCFTYNNQSILGAHAVARSAAAIQRRIREASHEKPAGNLRVLPVPTRVDQSEKRMLQRRQALARASFESMVDLSVLGNDYWARIEVPYIPYLAYEETLATITDDPADPKLALTPLVKLAEVLSNGEVQSFTQVLSDVKRREIQLAFSCIAASDSTVDDVQEEAGGEIAGQIALSVDARRVVGALSEPQVRDAEALWLAMIRVSETGERRVITLVRVDQRDVPERSLDVVQRFSEAGLLSVTNDGDTKEQFISPRQELAVSWESLHSWARSYSAFLEWRDSTLARFRRWERDRNQTALLGIEELPEAGIWIREGLVGPRLLDYVSQSEKQATADADRRAKRARMMKLAAIAGGIFAILITLMQALLLLNTRQEEGVLRKSIVDADNRAQARTHQLEEMAKGFAIRDAFQAIGNGPDGPRDAVQKFTRIIKQNDEQAVPDGLGQDPTPYLGRSFALAKLGKYAEAAADMKAAVDLQQVPEANNLYQLGTLYQHAGNTEAAIGAYERYIQLAKSASTTPMDKDNIGEAYTRLKCLHQRGAKCRMTSDS